MKSKGRADVGAGRTPKTGSTNIFRRRTAQAQPASSVWPNIDRKFRIPDNDYAKTYGYWRGCAYDKVSPLEAARKFVSSEAQMKLIQRRMMLHGGRAAESVPLEYCEPHAVPVKMARGEPVAHEILPFSGERALRSLMGLPTHRCHHPVTDEEAPERIFDFHEPEDDAREPGKDRGQPSGNQRRLHTAMLRRPSVKPPSRTVKPRCYSETEKLWKAPEFSDMQIKPRVFQDAGYAENMDGTLVSIRSQSKHVPDDFDSLTVRELLRRWDSPQATTARCRTASSGMLLSSRDQLRSSLSSGRPAWAKAERTNTTIIGNPRNASSTCIIQSEASPDKKLDTFTRLPDSWMTRVPNLGRVKDPFCVHLASEPLYCFNLHQARHERELHNISSLGVYRGGPVYNINFSQAIEK